MNALDPAGLECLAALAEAGSFDGAAQLLHITQSAVSQRLRSLESNVGHVLVVRERPLRLTEPGKVLLRYARQMQALRADAARELGATLNRDERLPIAVNPNSLATWVLPALDPLVQRGLQEGFGVELIVDDQDFTHDWLRQGEVLGCVSTVSQALRGCACQALGAMRYVAAASPAFVARHLPQGLNRRNFASCPSSPSTARTTCRPSGWPRPSACAIPSSRSASCPAARPWRAPRPWAGACRCCRSCWRAPLGQWRLQPVLPEVHLDVTLYWHQWKLSGEDGRPRATV
jgi:LysR family transcriptional regulator (chromosome initiation inhibitor)